MLSSFILGFTGGTLLKKKQEKVINTELQNLKESRSKSVPEELYGAFNGEVASKREETTPEKSSEDNSRETQVETVETLTSESNTCTGCTSGTSKTDGDDLDLIEVEDS